MKYLLVLCLLHTTLFLVSSDPLKSVYKGADFSAIKLSLDSKKVPANKRLEEVLSEFLRQRMAVGSNSSLLHRLDQCDKKIAEMILRLQNNEQSGKEFHEKFERDKKERNQQFYSQRKYVQEAMEEIETVVEEVKRLTQANMELSSKIHYLAIQIINEKIHGDRRAQIFEENIARLEEIMKKLQEKVGIIPESFLTKETFQKDSTFPESFTSPKDALSNAARAATQPPSPEVSTSLDVFFERQRHRKAAFVLDDENAELSSPAVCLRADSPLDENEIMRRFEHP